MQHFPQVPAAQTGFNPSVNESSNHQVNQGACTHDGNGGVSKFPVFSSFCVYFLSSSYLSGAVVAVSGIQESLSFSLLVRKKQGAPGKWGRE